MSNPRFITLEGIEGAGKTALLPLIKERLDELNIENITTREPGGCPSADEIRQFMFSKKPDYFDVKTYALLFYASRIEHMNSIIKPALNSGKWVICDRFIDSTRIYQGRSMPEEIIDMLEEKFIECMPDMTILLDLPVSEALARIALRKRGSNYLKSESHLQGIRNAYLDLARSARAEWRFRIIDANCSRQELADRVIKEISVFL